VTERGCALQHMRKPRNVAGGAGTAPRSDFAGLFSLISGICFWKKGLPARLLLRHASRSERRCNALGSSPAGNLSAIYAKLHERLTLGAARGIRLSYLRWVCLQTTTAALRHPRLAHRLFWQTRSEQAMDIILYSTTPSPPAACAAATFPLPSTLYAPYVSSTWAGLAWVTPLARDDFMRDATVP